LVFGHITQAFPDQISAVQVVKFDQSRIETRLLGGLNQPDQQPIEDLLPGAHKRVGLLGTFELASHPETPFKVVLNEAIELGKSFGATDGYRFVNGVLEKIAADLRPDEVARTKTNV